MNKQQFEQNKRLLWVYLRSGRKCSICDGDVNPREIATDREVTFNLGIDALLQVRLMHPYCKAAEARRQERRAA